MSYYTTLCILSQCKRSNHARLRITAASNCLWSRFDHYSKDNISSNRGRGSEKPGKETESPSRRWKLESSQCKAVKGLLCSFHCFALASEAVTRCSSTAVLNLLRLEDRLKILSHGWHCFFWV